MAIKALPLAPSFYSLDIGCRSGNSHLLDYLPSCSQVEVVSGPPLLDSWQKRSRACASPANGPGSLLDGQASCSSFHVGGCRAFGGHPLDSGLLCDM